MIDQYLLEQSQKLIFISLSEERLEQAQLDLIQNIDIPIFSTAISKLNQENKPGISAWDIAAAMMYIIGIDRYFRYNDHYIEFIRKFTDSPVNFAKDLIMKAYKRGELLDSIIYTKAYLNGFEEEEDFLFNYGALCEEYGNGLEEGDRKNHFLKEATQVMYPFVGEKIEKALIFLDREEWMFAEKLLLEVLKRNPEDFDANFYMGYLHRSQEKYSSALDYYEKAYHIDNRYPKLINEMALCFSFLGDLEQALELFQYAHSLDTESIEILCNLSMIYLNLDDFEKARKYANEACKLDPDDHIAQACIREIRKYE